MKKCCICLPWKSYVYNSVLYEQFERFGLPPLLDPSSSQVKPYSI